MKHRGLEVTRLFLIPEAVGFLNVCSRMLG